MYGKLFASLYQGTLRGRADEILVFTNLIACADRFGDVDKHWQAIADEVGISRSRVEAAILSLESPDPESRSKEMQGCRIVRIADDRCWGWHIVNFDKYRSIRNEDDRREQNRLAQARYRDKQKSDSNHSKPRSAHTEAEAEADTSTTPKSGVVDRTREKRTATILPDDFVVPNAWRDWARKNTPQIDVDLQAEAFVDHWISVPGQRGKKSNWESTWRNWCRSPYAAPAVRASSGVGLTPDQEDAARQERVAQVVEAFNRKRKIFENG